jgi:hypothetical protein
MSKISERKSKRLQKLVIRFDENKISESELYEYFYLSDLDEQDYKEELRRGLEEDYV